MGLENPKFGAYFASVYGPRWSFIYQALKEGNFHVLRKNKFSSHDLSGLRLTAFDALPESFKSEGDLHGLVDARLLKVFYKMDPASIFVADSLKIEAGFNILDMCAAPGGKSLILNEKLGQTGALISNEFSNQRRDRLVRVFQEYVPKEQRQNIFVRGQDGNAYGIKRPDAFDAVLADVPCSGERHLLQNPQEFSQWTERRSQNLGVRQFSLLSSAWLTARAGAQIVYSTCSISPFENDQVVKKLTKRRGVEILRRPEIEIFDFIERTEFGYQILPDTAGFGPMYFSVMLKV